MNEKSENRFSFDAPVEPHDPELYHYVSIARGVQGFDSVGDDELTGYHRDGYLVIHNAYSAQEIAAGREGIRDLVAGKHSDFDSLQFTEYVREGFDQLTLDQKLDGIRKLYSFTGVEPRLNAFVASPKLLAIIEKLLDAKPTLYQSMALLKPPAGREKPWHQDHSHFDLPLNTRVVGVWISLDAATVENGCMRAIPGGHRLGVIEHEMNRDFQIPDGEIARKAHEAVAIPMEPGGCLLFDSFLPHGTPINRSDRRRWAIQFHLIPEGTPRISHDERRAVFERKS